LGNCSTDDVIGLLRVRREEIEGFLAHEEAAFLARVNWQRRRTGAFSLAALCAADEGRRSQPE
jgi:hypothetical protein